MDGRVETRSGWIGALVRLILLGFFALGAWLLIDAVNFVQTAHRGEARVIELVADSSGDGLSHRAVVEYAGADGRLYQGITHIASSGYNFRKGERVRILFHPGDPGEVRIDSIFSLYGIGLIFAGASLLMLLILWAVGRSRRRRIVRAGAHTAAARKTSAPRESDLSKYGHMHEPKPPHEPTVRRMR